MEKRCARCGRGFDCGAGACWCRDVVLTPAQLAHIKARFQSCLCPACLSDPQVVGAPGTA